MTGPSFETAPDAGTARARKHALRGRAAYIGGGTALQLGWGEPGLAPPALTLIDVTRLPEAQGVARLDAPTGPVLRIGAAMRLEQLRTHPLVVQHAPLLARSLQTLAALGVRHLATLGGNIGWRWGDTLAPLLALEAVADIGNGPGAAVPLQAVLAAPELPLVLAVEIPLIPAYTLEVFEKIGLRAAFSPTRLAMALCAHVAAGRIEKLHVAVTGAQLPARRLWQVERTLVGRVPASLRPDELRIACAQDLPGEAARARLAMRLLTGHLRHAV